MASIQGTLLQKLYYAYFLSGGHPGKLRICRWVRRILRDARVLTPFFEGQIYADESDFVERHILRSGDYEPEVRDALLQFAERDEVLWDIGAHVGTTSLPLRNHPAVREIRAFEPHPEARDRLRRNLERNPGRATYEICDLGLGDRDEVLTISDGREGNSSTAALGGPGRFQIHTVTLDSCVKNWGSYPTLIKIDVEGWESNVFRGASETLQAHPPKAVVFEAETTRTGDLVDPGILDLLPGYKVSRIPRPEGTIESRENFLATLPRNPG